jgi:hypothetical protein
VRHNANCDNYDAQSCEEIVFVYWTRTCSFGKSFAARYIYDPGKDKLD